MKSSEETSMFRFLLVEPDEDRGQEIQLVLAKLGLPSDHVQSHLRALALTEDTTYHCLLVSAQGLDVSGLEFCAIIRARERRRFLPPSFLIMVCSEVDRSSIFSNTFDIDDYIVAPWLEVELRWKITRALNNLELCQVRHQERYFVEHGSGLMTQNGLRAFLYEEVNRVGRRQGWFSLSILSIFGLDGLRISYGEDWLYWFKNGIWASLYRQLRNYDRLAFMDTGLLGLISPDLDERGTLALLCRLDKVIQEYQFQSDHEEQPGIGLAARYLCVQVIGDYKQFERTGDILWRWLEDNMRKPMPQGLVGHTGTVALDINYTQSP